MSKKTEQFLQKRETQKMQVRASFMPDTMDVAKRTVRLQYTTGVRVYRFDWWDNQEYMEELSTKPGAVRLDRLKNGAPLLNSHNAYDLGAVCGVVEDGDETHATVRFATDPASEEIFQKVKDGILRNVSVGYNVYRYKDVTEKTDQMRVLQAVDWEPMEISIVAVPADAGAGIRAESKRHSCIIEVGHAPETEKREITMTEEEKAAAAAQKAAQDKKDTETRAAADLETARKDATKAEKLRQADIRKACRAAKMQEAEIQALIDSEQTVEQVRAAVIDKLAKGEEEKPVIAAQARDQDVRGVAVREAVQAALQHRYNPAKVQLTEAAKEFRGMSMLEIARRCLELRGVSTTGLSKMELAKRALHSTSDFPDILANVASKTLRDAYIETPRTFQRWARQGTLPDFKNVNRVQLGEAPNLSKVLEGGEYKYGTLGEGKETYRLSTYGKILSFTREMLINDDLSAFTRIPGMMGAAAARLESDIVYGILKDNDDLSDSVALFHATHGNLTDALLTVDGLGETRALLRKQKGLNGEARLNLEPRVLIVGSDLETVALKLRTETVPNDVDKVNPWRNTFDLVIDSRLDDIDSGESYFMTADPSQIDTVEFAYLEGGEGVYIETQMGFEVDGTQIKVRHDFGAKAIDFRGLAKSTNDHTDAP